MSSRFLGIIINVNAIYLSATKNNKTQFKHPLTNNAQLFCIARTHTNFKEYTKVPVEMEQDGYMRPPINNYEYYVSTVVHNIQFIFTTK